MGYAGLSLNQNSVFGNASAIFMNASQVQGQVDITTHGALMSLAGLNYGTLLEYSDATTTYYGNYSYDGPAGFGYIKIKG